MSTTYREGNFVGTKAFEAVLVNKRGELYLRIIFSVSPGLSIGDEISLWTYLSDDGPTLIPHGSIYERFYPVP